MVILKLPKDPVFSIQYGYEKRKRAKLLKTTVPRHYTRTCEECSRSLNGKEVFRVYWFDDEIINHGMIIKDYHICFDCGLDHEIYLARDKNMIIDRRSLI